MTRRRLFLAVLIASFGLGFTSHTPSASAEPSRAGGGPVPPGPPPAFTVPLWLFVTAMTAGLAALVWLRWRR